MPKSSTSLVIVESPAKAKTIERFLGPGFTVQASVGHVRDLPTSDSKLTPEQKKGSRHGIRIDEDFQPIYVVSPDKKDQVRTLKRLLKDADELWLATDEDREGEAISWHLMEVLNPKVPVRRLVFHEITKGAIQKALENPREIDMDLVEAQETRRILDRLYGYEISPVLWRKIRGARSAGRVQSVALRLLVERELERIAFRSAHFWDLAGTFSTTPGKQGSFEAGLTEVGGKRVATGRDFNPQTGLLNPGADVVHLDEAAAQALDQRLRGQPATVQGVEERPYSEAPKPPFTTSTLQQEAGRKLRMSAAQAMRTAQDLYQNGVITYMRTDSVALSGEAIDGARSFIRERYGETFLPERPRVYKTKVKNAQEAHEAIRPAGSRFQTVEDVRQKHGQQAARLYELIWMRTVASQMENARGRHVTVRIAIDDARFRAKGKTIEFAGFRRAYVEGSDDPTAELAERETLLPSLEEGQSLHTLSLTPTGHTTQPPGRYTEASLVKELDRRGIGRPSTWASIIKTLFDRDYAFKRSGGLIPTFVAIAVVQMLRKSFKEFIDFDFTARMEDDLDAVSRGEDDGKAYLRRFWLGNGSPGLQRLVESGIEEMDAREVSTITLGEHEGRPIHVRIGRFGLFLTDGESNASLDDHLPPDELTVEKALKILADAAAGPTPLGDDPDTKKPVYLKSGRFGPYVQLGDSEEGGPKPKMQSLLPGMEPGEVTLELALRILALPRDLGPHPEDEEKKPIEARTGRYGPYVTWGTESRSVPDTISILDITVEQAVEALKQPRRRRGSSSPKALKEIGEHPDSKKPLKLMSGRYGPYVTDGEINASLPKGNDPAELTIEEAVELLARRAERLKAGGGTRKKKVAKKKTVKKKTVKKKTAKKKATAKKKKAPKKKVAKKKAAKKKPGA